MNTFDTRFRFISATILIAGLSRILPHPHNFTPIAAMALFGAAYFDRKIFAFIIPLISIWLSSLVIDNVLYSNNGSFVWMSELFPNQALGFSLIALLGIFSLKKVKTANVVLSSIAGSVIFFLVTNNAFWPANPLYTQDFSGLMLSYAAGVPFFWNSLAGDLVYSGILFGGYALARQRFPVLASA